MSSDQIWILAAFVFYLLVMLSIGILYFRRTKNTEDYFLGGRKLGGWVAALSAQASDMSGWLLMGLPGAIYAFGTGQIWIAVGLAVGTLLNWVFVSSRLRRYTLKAGNSLTLPSYFENRFRDKTKILRVASSIFIMVFFLVYTASGFSAGAKLFSSVFGIDYTVALTIGVLVILAYTFLGGFMAVCVTDFIQGMMMLLALLTVPIFALSFLGGWGNMTDALSGSNVNVASFLNPMVDGTGAIGPVSIISQLGWALGYFGMPHILVRFMAIRSHSEVKKSRVIAMVWVALSLGAACMVGVIGRAYLPTVLQGSDTENVFIQMILQLFTKDLALPFIGGIFLCGILAAVMSTADSQLLVTASSISEDIYKGVVAKNASEKSRLLVSRITVAVVAVIAFLVALDPQSSVMGLVSNAWAGFGAAFGPVIILSLFWRRSNGAGAIAGMISGGLTVIIWDYLPLVSGQTLGTVTGFYSLVVGFAVGLLVMIAVSLVTKKPEQGILDEFDQVKNMKHLGEEETISAK
ncbi:MAG: sodium/proline symporter PutP [Clostridiales bacterium]|nr:sodium/proline symporter PutP [Clostridiales bacterium]